MHTNPDASKGLFAGSQYKHHAPHVLDSLRQPFLDGSDPSESVAAGTRGKEGLCSQFLRHRTRTESQVDPNRPSAGPAVVVSSTRSRHVGVELPGAIQSPRESVSALPRRYHDANVAAVSLEIYPWQDSDNPKPVAGIAAAAAAAKQPHAAPSDGIATVYEEAPSPCTDGPRSLSSRGVAEARSDTGAIRSSANGACAAGSGSARGERADGNGRPGSAGGATSAGSGRLSSSGSGRLSSSGSGRLNSGGSGSSGGGDEDAVRARCAEAHRRLLKEQERCVRMSREAGRRLEHESRSARMRAAKQMMREST